MKISILIFISLFSIFEAKLVNEENILLDTSLVIVWDKCGNESRVYESKLFELEQLMSKISVSYEARIDSVVFETQVESKTIEVKKIFLNSKAPTFSIFFEFKTNGTIEFVKDCPNSNLDRFRWKSDSAEFNGHVELFQ